MEERLLVALAGSFLALVVIGISAGIIIGSGMLLFLEIVGFFALIVGVFIAICIIIEYLTT